VALPADNTAIAIDAAYREAAIDHLENGTLFEADLEHMRYLDEHSIPDPQKEDLNFQSVEVIKQTIDPDGIGLFERAEEPVVPDTVFAPVPESPIDGAEPFPITKQTLNAIDSGTVDQISRGNPDMMVESPDGSLIKAGDYMAHLERDLAETHKEGELFDAAIACALREGL